jgi:hypothetical protein
MASIAFHVSPLRAARTIETVLRPLRLSCLIFLVAMVEPCRAETLEQWDACMAAASTGPQARQIERDIGVGGLHEHSLMVCGAKPTEGRTLLKEDCDRLFEMAPTLDCQISGAGGEGDRYLKTLDPGAFDEDRYWVLCGEVQAANPPVSRRRFGREVCGERLAGNGEKKNDAITEKNWVNHPRIVEVRSLYQAIEQAKSIGSLQRKERRFDDCAPYEDSVRLLYADQNGRPRIYSYEGGSDDSAVKHELYYDDNGKLRFAFIVASAVNGTHVEHRVYFAETGQKIWEIRKQLEGPGYSFPTKWPDAELIQDPVQAFNGKSGCPEIR